MNICGECGYLVIVGDPREAINECHCRPPAACDKGPAIYPRVKNGDPGCGEWTSKEPAKERPAALPTAVRAKKDKARSKALRK